MIAINDLTRRVGKLEAIATSLEKQNDEIKDSVRSLHTKGTYAAGAVFSGMLIFGWRFKGGVRLSGRKLYWKSCRQVS